MKGGETTVRGNEKYKISTKYYLVLKLLYARRGGGSLVGAKWMFFVRLMFGLRV